MSRFSPCALHLVPCAFSSQVQVDAAPLLVVFEFHNVEVISPGSEADLPASVSRACKLASDDPVSRMKPDQLGHHIAEEDLPQVLPVFVTKLGSFHGV